MRRTWQRIGGILGIVALLFAQIAVASHACSAQGMTAAAPAVVSTDGQDMGGDALCQKHCADENQSVKDGSGSLISLGFAAAFIATLDVPVVRVGILPTTPEPFLDSSPPPLHIRNCRFRN